MLKKLIIMALFVMAWTVPVAYAAPPGEMIAYAAHNYPMTVTQAVAAQAVAQKHSITLFKTTPAVMLVPAGSKLLTPYVALANRNNVVARGGHIGTVRSF